MQPRTQFNTDRMLVAIPLDLHKRLKPMLRVQPPAPWAWKEHWYQPRNKSKRNLTMILVGAGT